MTDRHLDYCAVRSACGRDLADEMFRRHIPVGIDVDQPGDQVALDAIVREASRCDDCPSSGDCDPPA